MGIAEDIRKTIQSKLVIRYRTAELQNDNDVTCMICARQFIVVGALCLFIKEEGHICNSCGERFAPEMTKAMAEYKHKDIRKLISQKKSEKSNLSKSEWKEVSENIEVLLKITQDIAKGLSRGIIEAPTGHIGLLHFAKDISKPPQKPGESEKDYDLRVKSYRITKLFEKIKKETWNRVNILNHYFVKLGKPTT